MVGSSLELLLENKDRNMMKSKIHTVIPLTSWLIVAHKVEREWGIHTERERERERDREREVECNTGRKIFNR